MRDCVLFGVNHPALVRHSGPDYGDCARDFRTALAYFRRVKELGKQSSATDSQEWRKEWEPIFRAAEAGKFPNRGLGVLEVAECIRQLRKSREVPNSHPR